MESFYFSGNVSHLLIEGLTLNNTKDLIIFLSGLISAAFLLESLQRISRECFRNVPRPSRPHKQLKRPRPDKFWMKQGVDETKIQEEKSSWLEMEERSRHDLSDEEVNQNGSCCRGECCGGLENSAEGHETTSLVDKATLCQDATELTEDQKMARVETMWKSLSLDVLNDRLEIYQTTCEERPDGWRNITRTYRVAFHFLQTVIHMVKITVGYLFMTVVMTYNAWFLVCIIGGATLGYLVFSSDLETLYADYAECYIMRKAAEDDAKQTTCPCSPPSEHDTNAEISKA